MSTAMKPSISEYLQGPKAEYEANYKVWANKKDWTLVGQIRGRIQEMYNARQNSCYLINYDGSKSFDKHWDLVEKDYLAYSEFNGTDDWESNLKSSIAYRTVAAIDARERKQEINFVVEARNEDDERTGIAMAHKYLFEDYFRRNTQIRYSFLEASKMAKIFGTSVAFIPYTVRIREVDYPVTPDLSDKDIKAGVIPEMKYEEKTIVDFEDADFVPWNIRDFYIDPQAKELHGTNHAAVDAAAISYLTPSQVRLMFQGDQDVKNLDRVDSMTHNTESYSSPFFSPPRDMEKGYGELIRYYNIETDSEIIIYGDVILKNGPIPYADKRLPFVSFHFVRHPGHFYGMGVSDITIQQSSEESAIKNARLDRIKFTTNPPVFIGATIFGDVDEQWDRMEPNMLIKVGDPSQIKSLELPNIPFDSFRISEELKDEAVMNTGVNPQGLSLPMSSTPATNTLAMKENMGDMINLYEDNMMAGMNNWGEILDSRFCQFYSRPTMKASLELGKKEMRELRLEDINLYSDEDGNYATREIKGSKIIPLDAKMFEWKGTPKVYINADFVSPISQAFKMRKAEEILPQLISLSGERGTPMANGQPAVIDVRKLVKWYLGEVEMGSEDLLLDETEDRVEEIQQAIDQQKKMQDGESVDGRPGEPVPHRYTHAVELMKLNETMESKEFQEMYISQDEQMFAFADAMDKYRRDLADHLKSDSILDVKSSEAAMAEADQVSQRLEQLLNPQPMMDPSMGGMQPGGMGQGPMGGAPMPRNNGVNVPTVSGNQGLPNAGGTMPVPMKGDQTDAMGQQMRI